MAFWGIELKPGKPYTHSQDKACGRLRISQATLGCGSSNKRSVVQCNVGNKRPILLCSLMPQKSESCHLDLEFEEAEDVTFSVLGPESVHLTGYYVGNFQRRVDVDDDSESFGEDIGQTDSDIPYHSDEEDEYEDSFIDDSDPKVSSFKNEASKGKTKMKKSCNAKSGLKRLKKKYVVVESDEDEIISAKNTVERPEKKHVVIESDEDESTSAKNTSSDPSVESDDQVPISSLCRGEKDLKRKMHQAESLTDEKQSEDKKVKKGKTSQESATSEDTESPLNSGKDDESNFVVQPGEQKIDERTHTEEDTESSLNSGKDDESDFVMQPGEQKSDERTHTVEDTESPLTSGKDDESNFVVQPGEQKSDERTHTLEDTESPLNSGTDDESNFVMQPGEQKSDERTHILSDGLIVEELEVGDVDGEIASSGKKVTVHFTGRRKKDGKIFDTTIGKAPLKFPLGKDLVIDGLDRGIVGMRVGSKRRLIIPPALGFGSEGIELVPPNSWLLLDVELLRIR